MKKLLMIIASALFIVVASAQTNPGETCQQIYNAKYCIASVDGKTILTRDGVIISEVVTFIAEARQPVAGYNPLQKTENMYCIACTDGKTIVTLNGEVISRYIRLKSGAYLTPDGEVEWKDKSRTALKQGACIDESGTIFGVPVALQAEKIDETKTASTDK
jgi:hypothetical protein